MCVLVVEDEPLIRLIVAEELADAGFAVCEAEDGTRAVAFIRDPPAALSLLITDVHLAGALNGIEVARLMRARHPSVPIIYITGRPDALSALGRLGEREALVPKPFSLAELLRVAKRLIAEHRDAGGPEAAHSGDTPARVPPPDRRGGQVPYTPHETAWPSSVANRCRTAP